MPRKRVTIGTPAEETADAWVGSEAKNKSKAGLRLTVDLTLELHRDFKALAAARGTTMRKLVRAYVEHEVEAAKARRNI